MRRMVVAALVACLLASGGAWAWARCSAMSGYSSSRSSFSFQPSAAQIAAAQAAAREFRRQKNKENRLKRVGAIAELEAQKRDRNTETRRGALEDRFMRAYDMGAEEREEIAKELYQTGRASEKRKSIDAAKDYYLFAMQIAPGSIWSIKAHEALIRLDAAERKTKGSTRGGEDGDSLLSQADVNDIRKGVGGGDDDDEDDDPDLRVRRMVEQLDEFPGERQRLLIIEELRTGRGIAYSNGLIEAIRRTDGSTQESARQALVDRFSRMTADTLRAKLASDEEESRLAAIKAAAARKKHALAPDLAQTLGDQNDDICQAARQALRDMTREDFGPDPGATTTDRFAARKRWEAWLEQQKGNNDR